MPLFSELLEYLRLRARVKRKALTSLRISKGTRVGQDTVARQVLRLNVIKSRLQRFPLQEIAYQYEISLRTAHKYTKLLPDFMKVKVLKLDYRRRVKLFQRAQLTKYWIRYYLRHKLGHLDMIMQAIEAGVKPP